MDTGTFPKEIFNPEWRISNLYKIIDKNAQFITFRPNKIQQLVNSKHALRKMILKPRQVGLTTNEVIKLFDKTAFTKNFTACLVAHEADAIKKIFRIAKRAHASMPELLKPELDRGGGSKYEMAFPLINSLIYCDLESRGDTLSHLHFSEAAFIDYERFISTMQALPIHGPCTIESTANGVGNWFYDMWHDDNEYEKFFFPWFMEPTYSIAGGSIKRTREEEVLAKHVEKTYGIVLTDGQFRFRRSKQMELKDYFLQEYPEDPETCFLLSGGSVVDRRVIGELLKKVAEIKDQRDGINFYDLPYSQGRYVISADPAQGVGNDWSVAVCWDVAKMEEAAILRAQLSPFQFARAIKRFADIFSTGGKLPLVAIENNNHGHAVLQELSEHIRYPRLYHSKDREGRDKALGWTTNSITRPIMLNQFIDAVTTEMVKINTPTTLQEMLTLINSNGKIEAASGRHDDCVMASAIGVQILICEKSKASLYDNVAKSIWV